MKNKRGFTLIELLAVIVILAIIALIAVPIILNMINEARKSSAKSSALGYIDAIEYNNGFAQLEKAGYTEITGEDLDVTEITVKLKGKKPSSGTVTVNDKGKVESASNLCFNGYAVDYDGQDAEVNGKCNGSNNNNNNNNQPQQTGGPTSTNVGDLVYFDPASTNACDSSHTTGETCYKWRIISKEGNNLTVQMDHNLVNLDRWSTGTSNTSGPDKALTRLASETTSWTRVPVLTNYTYDTTAATRNYGVMTCNDGICTKQGTSTLIAGTSEAPVRARLITGEEITTITKNAGAANNSKAGTWTVGSSSSNNYYYFSNSGYTIGTQTSGTNDKALSWLVENTKASTNSGATDNTYEATIYGYWTLSPVSDSSSYAWSVYYTGSLLYDSVNMTSRYGLRPVITLNKSYFSS